MLVKLGHAQGHLLGMDVSYSRSREGLEAAPCVVQGHGLPAMLDARLTAPKVLRMHKVATYTLSKLQDQGISLCLLPVPLPPQVRPTLHPAQSPQIEVLPACMSILCLLPVPPPPLPK